MNKEYGIKINVSETVTNFDDIVINGEFTIDNKDINIQANNEAFFKHIILIVTRSANYHAIAPFSNMVFFPDDVKINSNIVTGAFFLSLKDNIPFSGNGDYYVLCSLGVSLSNALKVSVVS